MRTTEEIYKLAMEDLRQIPAGEHETARVLCVVSRVQQAVMNDVIDIVRCEYERWKHAETEDFGIEIGAFGAVANIYCRLMGLEPSSEEQIRNVTTHHG